MTADEEMRDFEDSREKLEADVLSESASWLHTPYGFRKVRNWLDRQAAITRRECSGVDWFAIIHNLRDEIAELEDKVDRLTAERDEAVEAYDAHMAAHDAWHEAEDIEYTRNRFSIYEQVTKERVARLESERDALRAENMSLKANSDECVPRAIKKRDEVINILKTERDEACHDLEQAESTCMGQRREIEELREKLSAAIGHALEITRLQDLEEGK